MDTLIFLGSTAVVILAEIVSLIMTCLALGGGTWIQQVQSDGDYFLRVSYGEYSISSMINDEIESIGLWRYFYENDRSNPLPTKDPEIVVGIAIYFSCLGLGSVCVMLCVHQVVGVGRDSIVNNFLVMWMCFFQMGLLLAGNLVVLEYFNMTFEYQTLGYCHHVSWVAMGFAILAFLVSIIKVYLVLIDPKQDHMDTPRSKSVLRSPPSAASYRNGSEYGGSLQRVPKRPTPGQYYPDDYPQNDYSSYRA